MNENDCPSCLQLEKIIVAIAEAIEIRSGREPTADLVRLRHSTVALGEILELPAPELRILDLATILSGVGKLAISDHILHNTGRMYADAMERYKLHALVLPALFESAQSPIAFAETLKHHWERWDGSGYPDGLRGTEIPITSRILAITSAYNMLLRQQPSREALSRTDACEFLERSAGSFFDPTLVHLFLGNLADIESRLDSADVAKEPRVEAMVWNERLHHWIQGAGVETNSFFSFVKELNRRSSPDAIAQLIADFLSSSISFDVGVVFVLDRSRDHANPMACFGNLASEVSIGPIQVGEGATGYVLANGKSIHTIDPASDTVLWSLNRAGAFRAMMSIPLLAAGTVQGAVSVYSRSLMYFPDETYRFAASILAIAGDALYNSLSHQWMTASAMVDQKTGLLNSRGLEVEFATKSLDWMKSGDQRIVLVMDLNGFKKVNDTFGHLVGDELLKEVAAILGSFVETGDILARPGGDEFVAIVPDTGSAIAIRIAEKVQEFELAVETGKAQVGISIGSAHYPAEGTVLEGLIALADKRMYDTKKSRTQR